MVPSTVRLYSVAASAGKGFRNTAASCTRLRGALRFAVTTHLTSSSGVLRALLHCSCSADSSSGQRTRVAETPALLAAVPSSCPCLLCASLPSHTLLRASWYAVPTLTLLPVSLQEGCSGACTHRNIAFYISALFGAGMEEDKYLQVFVSV